MHTITIFLPDSPVILSIMLGITGLVIFKVAYKIIELIPGM